MVIEMGQAYWAFGGGENKPVKDNGDDLKLAWKKRIRIKGTRKKQVRGLSAFGAKKSENVLKYI